MYSIRGEKQMSEASRRNEISAPLRFEVELDGLFVGGFTEVTGLNSEIELVPYSEGGLNDYVHYSRGELRNQAICGIGTRML
jgi:hypothetical protein